MPNKWVLSAEISSPQNVGIKRYEFRKIEKIGKNHVPTCPVLQAWSQFYLHDNSATKLIFSNKMA